MNTLPRVVVLISGRGSNLAALLAAHLPVQFAAVISNRADAGGLILAQQHGIPTVVLDHTAFPGREAFDTALAQQIDQALAAGQAPGAPAQSDAGTTAGAGLIVLAGFMRILTPAFTARYAGRMINIHPSLLPAFTGLHTHQPALAAGVRVHGCTVHLVTAELDHGPILAQAAVPVLVGDDADQLAARVLRQEHRLYPAVVLAWAEGRIATDAHGISRVLQPVDDQGCLQVPG